MAGKTLASFLFISDSPFHVISIATFKHIVNKDSEAFGKLGDVHMHTMKPYLVMISRFGGLSGRIILRTPKPTSLTVAASSKLHVKLLVEHSYGQQ